MEIDYDVPEEVLDQGGCPRIGGLNSCLGRICPIYNGCYKYRPLTPSELRSRSRTLEKETSREPVLQPK